MDSSASHPVPAGDRLARVFEWGSASDRLWDPDEFRAIVEHLLRSPVQFDLAGLDPRVTGKVVRLSEAEGLTLKSFHELLTHEHPPFELLELTKEWAKTNRNSSESALPPEVASFLYFACIAAALGRLGRRITSLNDAQLRAGFGWAGAQSWVGTELTELFSLAQSKLPPEASADVSPSKPV
jgi:hypothetical protein